MKMKLLLVLVAIFIVHETIQAMELEKTALENLPNEILLPIVEKLIVPNDLDQTIENIKSFATVNRQFNNLINEPQNMKWLIAAIYSKGVGSKLKTASLLKNMPGVQNKEVQEWLNLHKLYVLNLLIAEGKLEEARKLIAQGVNLRGLDLFDNTVFDYVGAYPQIIKDLIENGADINQKVQMGGSPLNAAVQLSNVALVKEILKYNPDLSIKFPNGENVIDIARRYGDDEIVKLLEAYQQRQKEEKQYEFKEEKKG